MATTRRSRRRTTPARRKRRDKAGLVKMTCWLDAGVAATVRAIAAWRGVENGEVVQPALEKYLGKSSYVVDGVQLGIADVTAGEKSA